MKISLFIDYIINILSSHLDHCTTVMVLMKFQDMFLG